MQKPKALSQLARRLGFEPGCDGWLTQGEAAEFSGKTPQTIHLLGKQGKIVRWRSGSGWAYCKRSIKEHYTPKPV